MRSAAQIALPIAASFAVLVALLVSALYAERTRDQLDHARYRSPCVRSYEADGRTLCVMTPQAAVREARS